MADSIFLRENSIINTGSIIIEQLYWKFMSKEVERKKFRHKQTYNIYIIYQYFKLIWRFNKLPMILSTKTKLFQIFQEEQPKTTNYFAVNNIYSIIQLLRTDTQQFLTAFEQIYLKISKSLIKSLKKQPEKFIVIIKDIIDKLKIITEEKEKGKKQIKQLPVETIVRFYEFTLKFFSDIARSAHTQVKIFGSRLLFNLLNQILVEFIERNINPKIIKEVMQTDIMLLKHKMSNFKLLGIKISTILQTLKFPTLKEEKKAILNELLKILSIDDNQNIRMTAIKNLVLNEDTLKDFIVRLRDKSSENRMVVYKKLISQNISLEKLGVSNLYKVLYDGISSREITVKAECIKYFEKYFRIEKQKMQIENLYLDFVRIFNPDLLLHHPHLYMCFCQLLQKIIEESNSKEFHDHIKLICTNLKKKIITEEVIYLKIISNMKNQNLNSLLDEYYLSGMEQAEILFQAFSKNQYFQLNELLQLTNKLINLDETGRNKIFDTLCTILQSITNYIIEIPEDALLYENDVCRKITEMDIIKKRLLTPYYDQQIIHETNDFVIPILKIMKKLRPQYFEIQVLQLIAEINDENGENDFKRIRQGNKNIMQNLKKKKQSNPEIIKAFQLKDLENQKKIKIVQERTYKILYGLCQQSNSVPQALFLQTYRDNQNTSFGLLLLGIFSLSSLDFAKKYFKAIWQNFSEPKDKLFLLVSIRISTDLILKFNLLKIYNENQQFNSDLYMETLSKYIFDKDHDIRVLAIQALCKILYNEKVDNPTLYFIYILLLWWDTNVSQASSKSVHTISLFFKQYLQKSAQNLMQVSTLFQTFILTLKTIQQSKKIINKQILKYTLKHQQFMKKTLQVLLAILKYEKKDGTVKELPDMQKGKIGPQQSFILFLMIQQNCGKSIQNIIQASDFIDHTNVDVMIYMKEILTKHEKSRSNWISKFNAELDRRLTIKGDVPSLNYEAMKTQFMQHITLVKVETKQVLKNIERMDILIRDQNNSDVDQISDMSIMSQSESLSSPSVVQISKSSGMSKRQQRLRKRSQSRERSIQQTRYRRQKIPKIKQYDQKQEDQQGSDSKRRRRRQN